MNVVKIKPTLSDATRDEVKTELFNHRLSTMFGDGLEADYILSGVTITGLNEMEDSELIQELENYEDEEDELLMKAKAELAIDSLLQ